MGQAAENTEKSLDIAIKKLEKEHFHLRELYKEALLEIENLQKRLENYEKPDDGYNKRWTVITKIVFLITKADKPLLSAEIIPLLKEREPSIVNKQASLEKYLSAFLNTAVKHHRLIPHKLKGVRGNFYCLPQWIDTNNNLASEMRIKIY